MEITSSLTSYREEDDVPVFYSQQSNQGYAVSPMKEKPPLPYSHGPVVYQPPSSRHPSDRFGWYGVGLGKDVPMTNPPQKIVEDRTPVWNGELSEPNYTSYVVCSALTVLCCFPIGIVALIFSVMAMSNQQTNINKARLFGKIGGILIIVAMASCFFTLGIVLTFLHLNNIFGQQ